jgi:predicted translin family RNA/ssDNA-binding protein
MMDCKDFERMRKELDSFEADREKLIGVSREILNESKKAIYMVHRGELDKAEAALKSIEKKNSSIKPLLKCNPKLDFLGAYSAAIQEYVEARCYLGFVSSKRIPSCAGLKVQVEDYLCGLCDLTGELARRAVNSVISKDFSEVYRIREVVEEINGLFLELNLRNGELRKKSDAIKWNLKKIEDIVYDIKSKGLEC